VQHRKHTEVEQSQKRQLVYTVYLQRWLTRHRWETTQILWPCSAKIVVTKQH